MVFLVPRVCVFLHHCGGFILLVEWLVGQEVVRTNLTSLHQSSFVFFQTPLSIPSTILPELMDVSRGRPLLSLRIRVNLHHFQWAGDEKCLLEQYRTAGGGSIKWTWTPMKQSGQASDGLANVPFGSVTAGNVMREHVGHLREGKASPPPCPCVLLFLFCVKNTSLTVCTIA